MDRTGKGIKYTWRRLPGAAAEEVRNTLDRRGPKQSIGIFQGETGFPPSSLRLTEHELGMVPLII